MDTMIIPCGAEKLDHAAPAEKLYSSANFAHILSAAKAEAEAVGGRVLILSALHGLVELDQVIEPYDTKMGDAGCITAADLYAQVVEFGLEDDDVYAMLPKAYLGVLDAACQMVDCFVQDVYEAAPGIGYQRGVARVVRDTEF